MAPLLPLFVILALVLAGIGLYGTLSHFVAGRTREVECGSPSVRTEERS